MRTPDLLSSRTRTRGRGSQACYPALSDPSPDLPPFYFDPLINPISHRHAVKVGHICLSVCAALSIGLLVTSVPPPRSP